MPLGLLQKCLTSVTNLPPDYYWIEALPVRKARAMTPLLNQQRFWGISAYVAEQALSSSSDAKLERMRKQFSNPPLLTVNYATNPQWHEEVLKLTDGPGVDLVVEIGGTQTLVKSMKCTRRGGTISQVGYLSKQNLDDLAEFIPLLIDRRIILR